MFLLIFLAGCESVKNVEKSGSNSITGFFTKDTEQECQLECPVCPEPDTVNIEKVSPFFKNHKEGLIQFLHQADDYIVCEFPILEDADLAQILLDHDNKHEVKVILDRVGSFDNLGGYVPKPDSKYNDLLAEGLDVGFTDTHSNYCATEDGVFITSDNLKNDAPAQSIIFFNSNLSIIYKKNFEEVWKNVK